MSSDLSPRATPAAIAAAKAYRELRAQRLALQRQADSIGKDEAAALQRLMGFLKKAPGERLLLPKTTGFVAVRVERSQRSRPAWAQFAKEHIDQTTIDRYLLTLPIVPIIQWDEV